MGKFPVWNRRNGAKSSRKQPEKWITIWIYRLLNKITRQISKLEHFKQNIQVIPLANSETRLYRSINVPLNYLAKSTSEPPSAPLAPSISITRCRIWLFLFPNRWRIFRASCSCKGQVWRASGTKTTRLGTKSVTKKCKDSGKFLLTWLETVSCVF